MGLTNKTANVAAAKVQLGDDILRETGTGAVGASITASSNMRVLAVMLHLSGPATVSESLSAEINSASGVPYNQVLFSQDVNGLSDVTMTDAFIIPQGDTLEIGFANSDALTYGLTVLYTDGV